MKDTLGKDICVIPYMTAHDAAEGDCAVSSRPDKSRKAAAGSSLDDIAVVEDRRNLAQALILRLLTPKGSLASLGHAAYGSRLTELIGRPKTKAVRNLCRLFVLETLAQEPRIEPKAVSFQFDETAESIDNLVFLCQVKPLYSPDPLAISLEVSL
jgi:phage baseplate assembly protein W